MLRRLIFTARARIALLNAAPAIALMLFAAGCSHQRTSRLPAPPARVGTTETGLASWYGVPYDGRLSASGEIFDMQKLTAAHRTLPFQTWVEVTNLANGKRVDLRITDRGPFVNGRILDVSMAAARQLDMVQSGVTRVRMKVIEPPSSEPPLGDLASSRPQLSKAPSSDSARVPNIAAKPAASAPIVITPANFPALSGPATDQPPANALDDQRSIATTAGIGGSAVQVGAFSDAARAEAFRHSLPYPETRVVERPGDPSLWRVLVGHNLSLQAATSLAAEVRKGSGQAVVVKEDMTPAK